jgi:hypothetical protein
MLDLTGRLTGMIDSMESGITIASEKTNPILLFPAIVTKVFHLSQGFFQKLPQEYVLPVFRDFDAGLESSPNGCSESNHGNAYRHHSLRMTIG